MEQFPNGIAAIPVLAPESSADAQNSGAITHNTPFWPSFLMAAAMSSIAIGIVWDISWHETIGRDTFWTPAHMAIYLGGALAGCVGGWLAIKHTFFARIAERDASVRVFGARAPLGAWVAIWGALAMITSAPFDDWWHNAYGLDVKIISPPHAVLGLGMFGIGVGALLLVLSRQNRLQAGARTFQSAATLDGRIAAGFSKTAEDSEVAADWKVRASGRVSSSKGSGLFIYAGGVFVLLGSVFILEYIFPNMQHAAIFYKVCAIMYPARLVALSCAGRVSWPATRVAAVYMAFLCLMDWILVLFPAQPKLAPIFNPVTHMVPEPFPLLLVFPAIALDLLLRNKGEVEGRLRRVAFAILLGGIFFAVLLAAQWPFSKFLISPHANNWFFLGNRVWDYNTQAGDWQTQFWHVDPKRSDADLLNFSGIITIWAIASASSWVGLFFGRWMKKVRR